MLSQNKKCKSKTQLTPKTLITLNNFLGGRMPQTKIAKRKALKLAILVKINTPTYSNNIDIHAEKISIAKHY